MANPLRIGFLGAGLSATYHSKSLHRSGALVTRAGVFDPDIQRAADFAAASGHTVLDNEDEVIDTCDALYICTWTSEHPRQLAKALAAGRHVFCEKPLATTLHEAERMATLARSAGLTHQVGLSLRYSPAYLWAKHLLDMPDSGAVMSVIFRDDQLSPVQGHDESAWRGDKALAGTGTLLAHSIHDVDMLRYFVGEVASVSASTASFHGIDGTEDVAAATLTFTNGAIGTLNSVWHDNLARPSLRRVELFCQRRYVVIEGDDWDGPVSWTDADGTSGSLCGDDLETAVAPLRTRCPNPDGAFIESAINNEPAYPDLTVAVAAHRIVESMYLSANQGGAPMPVHRER